MDKIIKLLMLFSIFTGMVACQTRKGIQVKDAWGRAQPSAIPNGVFYMTLRNHNDEADRLLAIETSACTKVELHETYMTNEGAMGMRPVEGDSIEIPAKGKVKLEPGGVHVMCIGKKEDFSKGKKIPLLLKFEKAGEVSITAEIKETIEMDH